MANMADHDHDTHKEVYAAPDNHYLGSPNNEPKPPVPENYPETTPVSGLEAVHPDEVKFTGLYHPKIDTNSPIPVTATTATFGGSTVAGHEDGQGDPPATDVPAEKKPWHQNWTIRLAIIAAAVIIIVAIIVGAVVGTRANNDQGGESDNANETTSSSEPTPEPSATETTATTSAAVETSSSGIEIPDDDDIRMGVSYNATFTMYGTGDGSGGTDCNNARNACGFYGDVSLSALSYLKLQLPCETSETNKPFPTSQPGYSIGVSENLFGIPTGPDDISPMCGTCWLLETEEDASGNVLRRNITAIVNNSCSGDEGDICGMRSLDDLNDWDAVVNFNLCIDSGARDGLFGRNKETGLAFGRVTRVSCDDWDGEKVDS